jgi:NAD(P)-dependent dehydrogenase (short-subunit alcohol dehydrogenase family)
VAGLSGRVALVTGAASGNGRAIALRFAEQGAGLALGDLDAAGLDDTAARVRELGRAVVAQRCDVSKTADIDALVATCVAELGALDIAVANAGVVELDTDCLRLTEGQWDRTLDVNLKGVFFTLQAAARRMLEQGRGGRLIAIGSIMGEWGSPSTPAYSASKGGVRQLVRSFALQCGRYGITCNAIGPGFIRTAMTKMVQDNPMLEGFLLDRTPNGAMGEPGDVAALAAYLASDEARFVNGSTIVADGGITAGMYSAAAAALADDDAQA